MDAVHVHHECFNYSRAEHGAIFVFQRERLPKMKGKHANQSSSHCRLSFRERTRSFAERKTIMIDAPIPELQFQLHRTGREPRIPE
jgi:hypothetical protein